MVSLQVGWALSVLGSEPCTGVAGNGAVLRTTDGGRDWSTVSPPAGAPQKRLFQLDALSATRAVVVTAAPSTSDPASVDITNNGGSTWTTSALPGQLPAGVPASVDFVGQDGWIMMVSDATMAQQEVMVYRSTDSGATWHVVERTLWSGPPAPGTISVGGYKAGLVFHSDQSGWAAASNNGNGRPQLFATTDGGATWSTEEITVPAGVPGNWTATMLPSFFTPTTGVLPLVFGGGSAEELSIYTTGDGGTTWRAGPLQPIPGAGLTPPVATAAPDNVWVADGSTLDFSKDGGQTWTTITPGAPFADADMLDFLDPMQGWAIEGGTTGGDELVLTDDGGRTWTALEPSVTPAKPATR